MPRPALTRKVGAGFLVADCCALAAVVLTGQVLWFTLVWVAIVMGQGAAVVELGRIVRRDRNRDQR